MGVVGIDRDEDTDDDHRVNGSIPDLSLRSWVDAYNVGERRWMEAQIVDAYEDRVLLHYKGFGYATTFTSHAEASFVVLGSARLSTNGLSEVRRGSDLFIPTRLRGQARRTPRTGALGID